MGRRGLVVLTDSYPYDWGEEFFEQEIGYLASVFDRIWIVPVRVEEGAEPTRTLPDNATALLLPRRRIRSWQAEALARAPQILLGPDRMVETSPLRSFGRFGMDVRFASNALSVKSRFLKVFPFDELADVDSVVVYSYWFFTGTALAGMVRKEIEKQCPSTIVSRAHAYDIDEDAAPRQYIPSRRFVMGAADRVFPISDYAAGFLARRFPDRMSKVSVQRLGVPRAVFRERRGGDPFTLVSCSHMAVYKRVDLLVRAVAELERRGVPVEWTHIGEADPGRLTAMRELADREIHTSKVTFTGHLSNAEVRDLYATSDLSAFVNCSDGEGVPVSVMEAQSTGLPVVATAAGGTGEIVWDGRNGRLIPVDVTPGQIADAIESIRNLTADEYAEYSACARETWSVRSDAERQYDEFAALLSSAADRVASHKRQA